MTAAARPVAVTASGPREISPADFDRMRFGWLESVRRAEALSTTAKLLAHVLALDYANRATGQCNPSHIELAAVMGVSEDTIKRAIDGLVSGGWIARQTGRGRGRRSGYAFLTRAVVLPIKGGKFAPSKGGADAGFYGSEKGANLPDKRGQNCVPHIEPCFNQKKGATGTANFQGVSLGVFNEAQGAVRRFNDGRIADAFATVPDWMLPAVLAHVRAANLLTEAQLADAGFAMKGDV